MMRPDPLIQSGTIPALHKVPALNNQGLNKKNPHAFNGAPARGRGGPQNRQGPCFCSIERRLRKCRTLAFRLRAIGRDIFATCHSGSGP